MPTPERASLDDIVAAARDLLESDGLPRLTMQAVADRVGVRAPSLYKRVRNRDDLVRIVTEATIRDLGDRLNAVTASGDARTDLGELAREFRRFAHARPGGYRLVFAPAGPGMTGAVAHAVAPILRVVTELAGPAQALEAARLVTAWANGFVSMELAGAFNLGGDVDEAYEYGITRLTGALSPQAGS
jgi:AcrR family transcriptional regulator